MARARFKQTALVETPPVQERKKPQLDPRFIISIDGNEFVKYQGLLDLGHQKGIEQIDVAIVQIPTADKDHFAICRAVVTSKNGEVFSDIHRTNRRRPRRQCWNRQRYCRKPGQSHSLSRMPSLNRIRRKLFT